MTTANDCQIAEEYQDQINYLARLLAEAATSANAARHDTWAAWADAKSDNQQAAWVSASATAHDCQRALEHFQFIQAKFKTTGLTSAPTAPGAGNRT